MQFDKQPTLENELVKIVPLKEQDFETLYAVASDPMIWEQHPNKNRYQREVFQNFFKGALESEGAFLVLEKETGNAIGSSRYYELDEENKTVAIGYTFIARNYWGKGYNRALKQLMLDYAFIFVNQVILHIGAVNVRSQKAAEKLGAVKIAEENITYYGEAPKLNYTYQIEKRNWVR